MRPWSANWRLSARWARSVLATTMQAGGVLVEAVHDAGPPRRRRCRRGCAPQWAISALTSVPVQLPAAGCTTRPCGLSITMMLVVLEHDVERDVLPAAIAGSGARQRERDGVAGVDAVAGIADRAAADRDRRRRGSAP